MKSIFKRPLISYILIIFLIVLGTGALLAQIVDHYILLALILFMEFFVLLIVLMRFYGNYIRPMSKAAKTIDKILEGNYHARFNYSPTNSLVSDIGFKINRLSKSLAEFSIQEEMQSEQLSTLIDHIQSGLVLIERKGYIQLVNRKFLSMFGKSAKDYLGYLYYDVMDYEILDETVQKVFLYEKRVKESFTLTVDSTKFYYEVIGAPILNEKNILKGAVLVIYDITEMKKLELMRKDFVANVSHELKTPVTSIKGFAETLLDGGIEDKNVTTDFLEIIHQESNRLQLLIEELLTLSKLEREDFNLVRSEINAKELIDEIIPTFRQKIQEKKLTLSVDNQHDILFRAEREQVKQIIVNLLDNAINYTPENGSVSVMVDSTDEYVHFTVSDTGMGIDEKSLSRIFERFYRVDKARSRNTGGTGLGLAIVKHIVEVHEGKIKVDSEVNKGTNMHVYLPKHDADH